MNQDPAAEFGRALIEETRLRLFDESARRLRLSLELLDDDAIWRRPNEQSNSVGNLVLHLAGNVRQWIVSGLGGAPDSRRRAAEFAERGPLPRSELIEHLDAVLAEARTVLDRLPPEGLLETRRIQGFETTGLSVLVHVVEHFSYHVGQISWVAKAHAARDLGYYRGVDLDKTGDA